MQSVHHQRGIAVLTAMLIVTLATVLAVEILWQFNLDLRRTEAILTRDQARQYALGAESWVISLFRADLAANGNTTDNLEDFWARKIPPLPIEGGAVEGHIVDLQGRFNLNRLIDPDGGRNQLAYDQLQRLLQILDLDPGLADAVVDWIDPDDIASLSGAEDDTYTSRQPPYRTANFWFTSPTELMAVEGFDQDIYRKLAPFVSALPPMSGTAVNVNTAPAEVLQALDPQFSAADADRLIADRPFQDRADFQQDVSPQVWPFLDVSTHYFGLSVVVTIGSTRLTMYSLLAKNDRDMVPVLRSYDLPAPTRTDLKHDQ